MHPAVLLLVASFLAALAWPRASSAQQFTYAGDPARAVQTLSFRYTAITFDYDGSADTLSGPLRFDYEGPVYGATYTRPNVSLSLAVGTGPTANVDEPRDLWVVDAALFTWGEFYPVQALAGERLRLFLPILLHSGFRRVARRGGASNNPADAFSVTTLGLGTGLGAYGQLGPRVLVALRATPIFGLAARSFGESAGSTRLFDSDVQLHFGPFVDRFGLSVGYAFRGQVWNASSSDLFNQITDDLFDYRGRQHTLRVGVNF